MDSRESTIAATPNRDRSSDEIKENGAAQAAKESLGDAADAVKNAAGNAKESIVGAFDHTKERIGERADSAQESITGSYEKLQRRSRRARTHGHDVLEQTSDRLNDMLDTTKQRYQACLRENPLAMVVGALGAGIVSAALVPVSRKEDEWFGEASDKVTDQLKGEGEKLVEKGKQVGERVAHAAFEEAESTDSPTEILTEAVEQANQKVRLFIAHVSDEATSAAGDEGLTVKSAEQLVREKLGSEESKMESKT